MSCGRSPGGIMSLAVTAPRDLARELFLGVRDKGAPDLDDGVAIGRLMLFVGVSSEGDLTSLDFFIGVDHIEDVLGR